MKPFQSGFQNWSLWTEEQKATLGMSLREAANKAGMVCRLGFEKVWLNGVGVPYGKARQIIGERLLTKN